KLQGGLFRLTSRCVGNIPGDEDKSCADIPGDDFKDIAGEKKAIGCRVALRLRN
ncbi:MAG TPA: hypothetical protein HPP95_01050, partial [Deltaproteobacteria bacterium]|nr:hypothetical protein [Deltaproteobacteria bacterium]